MSDIDPRSFVPVEDIVDRLYRLDADHRGVIDGLGEGAREIERLRHDIERHIAIASEAQTENERLRSVNAALLRSLEKMRVVTKLYIGTPFEEADAALKLAKEQKP